METSNRGLELEICKVHISLSGVQGELNFDCQWIRSFKEEIEFALTTYSLLGIRAARTRSGYCNMVCRRSQKIWA